MSHNGDHPLLLYKVAATKNKLYFFKSPTVWKTFDEGIKLYRLFQKKSKSIISVKLIFKRFFIMPLSSPDEGLLSY